MYHPLVHFPMLLPGHLFILKFVEEDLLVMDVMRIGQFVKANQRTQHMISKETVNGIGAGSNYPSDWKVSSDEIESLYQEYFRVMSTTNGDSGPIEITARQLIMFLDSYLDKHAFVCPQRNICLLYHEEYN